MNNLDTFFFIDIMLLLHSVRMKNAGIAQLVERNLAKVEVASSRLVSRSRVISYSTRLKSTNGGMAEWSCSGLQIRVRRFDSDSRLQIILEFHGGVAE